VTQTKLRPLECRVVNRLDKLAKVQPNPTEKLGHHTDEIARDVACRERRHRELSITSGTWEMINGVDKG
jgi:hypothetical protein